MGALLQNTVFGRTKIPVIPFSSEWNTTNTSAGSSGSNQIKLPLISTGVYNMTVDWGDSTTSTITAWNQAEVTHTYSSSGLYTITITGICNGFQFADGGDKLKIGKINTWGVLRLGTSQGAYFQGCANLNLTTVSDIINLTGVVGLGFCFRSTNITTVNRMNEWDTSGVTNISGMFTLATSFNQNIGAWNTSNITNMSNVFNGATLFNQNIGAWNTSNVTNMNGTFFNASSFNQNISSWDMANVTNIISMFNGATAFNQNIGIWNVSNVTLMNNFMSTKTPATFSTTNLDAIYNGWSSRPVKTPITISFGTAKHTAGASAGKAILTGAPNNWVITDGGI